MNYAWYASFYQGTKKQTNDQKSRINAQDASKVYTDKIVDVIVCATANVIGYNLAIFQNIDGQAIIYSHNVSIHCTSSMTTVEVLIVLNITVQ